MAHGTTDVTVLLSLLCVAVHQLEQGVRLSVRDDRYVCSSGKHEGYGDTLTEAVQNYLEISCG